MVNQLLSVGTAKAHVVKQVSNPSDVRPKSVRQGTELDIEPAVMEKVVFAPLLPAEACTFGQQLSEECCGLLVLRRVQDLEFRQPGIERDQRRVFLEESGDPFETGMTAAAAETRVDLLRALDRA